MLAELRAERDEVDQAMLVLQRIALDAGGAVEDHRLGCRM